MIEAAPPNHTHRQRGRRLGTWKQPLTAGLIRSDTRPIILQKASCSWSALKGHPVLTLSSKYILMSFPPKISRAVNQSLSFNQLRLTACSAILQQQLALIQQANTRLKFFYGDGNNKINIVWKAKEGYLRRKVGMQDNNFIWRRTGIDKVLY